MTGVAPAPIARRPGQFYFTPGVRIRRLGDTLQTSGEAGSDLPGHVMADLLSAQVTLVNTGLSTYTLTFNNTVLTTARDRAELGGAAAGPWPRYKYNDFDLLRFGYRLRVDFRYWPDAPEDADRKTAASQAWVPMVSGPITDMRFTFVENEGARLVVTGEDDLQPLKEKSERRVPFNRLGELSMVKKALGQTGFAGGRIASPLVDYPSFAESDDQGLNDALQAGQSYLEFIQKLADRLDFEVFLEFSDLGDPDSALEFHFEPYRGRSKPEASDLYTLERDKNLIAFTPTLSVAGQYTDVEVRGRHRDPQEPTEVLGKATVAALDEELHTGSQDKRLATASAVREFFFRGRKNKAGPPNVPNLDQARADWMALGLLRKKARELLTVSGTTVGLPRLRPGRHIEIRGMQAPFDGFYYLTRTVHSYDAKGLLTQFTASRPGMALPPYERSNATGGAAR